MTACEIVITPQNDVMGPPNLIGLDSISTSSRTSSSDYSCPSHSSFSTSSSSMQVRSKYLRRIGIVRTFTTAIEAAMQNNIQRSSGAEGRTARDVHNVPRFNEPLRYIEEAEEKRDENDEHRRGRRNSFGSEECKRKKRVTFGENVTVVPIPMRSEYSDRIKTKLWTGGAELCKIVDRNQEEFAAEDYDWRSACPEERMYLCIDTHELIHPIHLELGRYTFGTGGRVIKSHEDFNYC